MPKSLGPPEARRCRPLLRFANGPPHSFPRVALTFALAASRGAARCSPFPVPALDMAKVSVGVTGHAAASLAGRASPRLARLHRLGSLSRPVRVGQGRIQGEGKFGSRMRSHHRVRLG